MRRLRHIARALAGVAALVFVAGAHAVTLPPHFQDSVAISGLQNPTAVRFSPDGRVFVAEKSGRIVVYSDLSDRTPTVFADLSTNVYNYWDRGLLGLALAPDFPTDPHVYVSYTYDAEIGGVAPKWGTPGILSDDCPDPSGNGCVVSGRVSRLEADGDAMTGPEQVLVEDWCQQYPSHSMGDLVFGPDGALYATGGDGASFDFADYGQYGDPRNPCDDPPVPVGAQQTLPTAEGGALRTQDLTSGTDPVGLNGSIIRIDPETGAAMTGNPLWSHPDAKARRIVAYGLRNPFRVAFQPNTDELWIGDVGYDSAEEIDILSAPALAPVENYGWPCYEGPQFQFKYRALDLNLCEGLYDVGDATEYPFFHYWHDAEDPVYPGDPCPRGGASISGLAFGGEASLPGYGGALFFADYTRNCIWVAKADGDGDPDAGQVEIFASEASGPVDLEIGPGGDLFYVDLVGGAIRRIHHLGDDSAPVADIAADPTSGAVPLPVTFDATGSSDPDPGDTLRYAWDLDGDGALDDSTSPTPSYTYEDAGTYTVTLEVTDSHSATATASVVIYAGNSPPEVAIDTPTGEDTWAVGDTISFSGSAADNEDGALGAAALTWTLRLRHCSAPSVCHTHEIDQFAGVASGSFLAPNHAYPSFLELVLTAEDSLGASATTSARLQPQTVALTFKTNPAGLRLEVEGERTAPFIRTMIVGSTTTLTAPSPQVVSGTPFTFTAWSDGGARSHELVTPQLATTYTATFAGPPPPPPPVAPPPPPVPAPPPPVAPPPPAVPPPPPVSPPPLQPKPPMIKRCTVPKVVGKSLAAARRALVAARCSTGRVSKAYSGKFRRGLVAAQSPRPRTRLPRGGKVRLVVSRGSRR